VLELPALPPGSGDPVNPVSVGPPDTGAPPITEPPSSEPVPGDPSPDTTKRLGPSTTLPAATIDELRRRVAAELAPLGAQTSALIMMNGKPVIERAPMEPRIPASTQKLYVAAAALNLLGPEFRYATSVVVDAPPVAGAVGVLTIVGGGDPTFSSADLRKLAAAVRVSGITSITGRLQVDDARYDRVITAPGWKPSFSPGEAGALNALMVDGNHTSERGFLADPALGNLVKFQTELRQAGITVTAVLGRGAADTNASVVARHQSATLDKILAIVGKKSNNTYAEMLLKELGRRRGVGSTANGSEIVNEHLAALGVFAPQRVADGSGLSSLNRTSVQSEVALLTKMDAGKHRSLFRSSLAIACVDGTLKSRLCGTSGAKVVVAKTGTIDGVVALSGYAVTLSGKPVTFSFLLNGLRGGASGRAAVDRVLLQVLSYTGP
jgi:serine-type D-Ala-D-Ala carboxypeptidase/endopeptidase (penicillin-binding protein 4)